MAPLLQVNRVSKSYPDLPVLKEATFNAVEGEIVCLLGPSGGGKTTLLRIVAGLEKPDTGNVVFDARDLAGIPVHLRNFGFMFQDYALFPHKNVAENVAFGLRMQGLPPSEIETRVREALAQVALPGFERRRVIELSGGEQQRVALARSLAPQPRLLMLDEPLGSLDRALREQLMNEVRSILKRVGLTALYVTHDQGEAFAVADRVLIMRADPQGGWIEQEGTPVHVYRCPATPYVARFLGFKNLLPGTVTAEGYVRTAIGTLQAADVAALPPAGVAVTVLVRPEAAELRTAGETGTNIVNGRILDASFRGGYYLLRSIHGDGVEMVTSISAADGDLSRTGEQVTLWLDPDAITLLPG